jgi:hypothetical protein
VGDKALKRLGILMSMLTGAIVRLNRLGMYMKGF